MTIAARMLFSFIPESCQSLLYETHNQQYDNSIVKRFCFDAAGPMYLRHVTMTPNEGLEFHSSGNQALKMVLQKAVHLTKAISIAIDLSAQQCQLLKRYSPSNGRISTMHLSSLKQGT